MSKTLNTRLDNALVDEVHKLASKERISISEVVRRALVSYLKLNHEPHSEQLMFEYAKTRAVMLHFLELQLGAEKADAALAEAEEVAREYVKEKLLGKEKL